MTIKSKPDDKKQALTNKVNELKKAISDTQKQLDGKNKQLSDLHKQLDEVTVKGSDGKMKVLPKTGETANIALSILGSLITLASGLFLFKRNKKEQA